MARMSPVARLAWSALILAASSACRPAPSREEALAAMRRARPALDSGTVVARVWRDGPPWFSCAEVLAKLRSSADSAAVRDQVGNWHPLVKQSWLILRDTAAGTVTEPGWCEAKLAGGAASAAHWAPFAGDPFPTGEARRGWTVPVGRPKLTIAGPAHATGRDSARAEFLVSIVPNEDGRALEADRDTTRFTAALVKRDGGWQVTQVEGPATPPVPD